jgi:hypothetical protein
MRQQLQEGQSTLTAMPLAPSMAAEMPDRRIHSEVPGFHRLEFRFHFSA